MPMEICLIDAFQVNSLYKIQEQVDKRAFIRMLK